MLSVYPNPAVIGKLLTGPLTGVGNYKKADLNLYDGLGRQVAREQVSLTG
ncbi:hypothetical protein J0X19_04435 [Hymenobacter sp. BT186]|uniref:Uncharacterized protein n=1 Tax=Hymenobacter telluris TaxID=2816474 RepID=A0A939ETE1_9BACT|nr:hypothetical protein [Hymenobacter telluris]MBO0357180.1 hypothetical protein [Hymenobacter telluris]